MEYSDVNLEEGEEFNDGTPSFLQDYRQRYRVNPYEAALEWRFAARVGLAVNYGLHAVHGKGEHALDNGAVTPEQYRELPKCLNAASFSAIDIVELCIAAGARYLRFPAILPDGFCMFNIPGGDFHSVASAAQRDFVAEIASTCEFHGIGLGLEINLRADGVDGLSEKEHIDALYQHLKRLLTGYGPIAEIVLRNVSGKALSGLDMEDLYKYIRNLQNCTLISFGTAAAGTADVLSVEGMEIPDGLPQGKPLELQYFAGGSERGFMAELPHLPLDSEKIWSALKAGAAQNACTLIHVPLNPDGSFNKDDLTALLDVGMKLESQGLK